jgi:hypothetical protein
MSSQAPASRIFLKQYVSERLPQLHQGDFEAPGDPPSFTVDQRYVPIHDPTYRV